MDLADGFNLQSWTKVETQSQEGFKHYQICRRVNQKGKMTYVIIDDDGEPSQVSMDGVELNKDPLDGLANVQLRVNAKTNKIVGVMVDDDCLLYNG